MVNIRKDLIRKELNRHKNLRYKPTKLTNRFIDNLFRHYYVHECCENFYDSEPTFDDEEYNMYLDFRDSITITPKTFWKIAIGENRDDFKFCKQEHTRVEMKAAYLRVTEEYEKYEPKRIEKLTWQEPYFKGNWDMSQEYVDSISRNFINKFKKLPVKKDGRIFMAKDNDRLDIYIYARDVMKTDFWFIFKKRKRRLDKMNF